MASHSQIHCRHVSMSGTAASRAWRHGPRSTRTSTAAIPLCCAQATPATGVRPAAREAFPARKSILDSVLIGACCDQPWPHPVRAGGRERCDLEVGDPLGRGHVTVQPGHHHPRREAVLDGRACPFIATASRASSPVEHDLQRAAARGRPAWGSAGRPRRLTSRRVISSRPATAPAAAVTTATPLEVRNCRRPGHRGGGGSSGLGSKMKEEARVPSGISSGVSSGSTARAGPVPGGEPSVSAARTRPAARTLRRLRRPESVPSSSAVAVSLVSAAARPTQAKPAAPSGRTETPYPGIPIAAANRARSTRMPASSAFLSSAPNAVMAKSLTGGGARSMAAWPTANTGELCGTVRLAASWAIPIATAAASTPPRNRRRPSGCRGCSPAAGGGVMAGSRVAAATTLPADPSFSAERRLRSAYR